MVAFIIAMFFLYIFIAIVGYMDNKARRNNMRHYQSHRCYRDFD
jgi:hypothetical protein